MSTRRRAERRNSAFAGIVLVELVLAWAAAAFFSGVADAILLRPPALPATDRLVLVIAATDGSAR